MPKSRLRVLYLGPGEDATHQPLSSAPFQARAARLLQSRRGEFCGFLAEHFVSVTAVTPDGFSEHLAGSHDVTIFDAVPKPVGNRDEGGFERDRYLADEFSGAVLCIGNVTWRLFGRMGNGRKLDHL